MKDKLYINKNALMKVYKGEYILITDYEIDYEKEIKSKNDTISSLGAEISNLRHEKEELDKLYQESQRSLKSASNQFKEGNIKLTYTRLNGKVETFMIDKNENLSKNFKVNEFLSPDSNDLILDEMLITIAQNIRDKYKKPITITSGYRTQTYNDSLKGSIKNSEHVKGKAIDFIVSGTNKTTVLNYAKTIPNVVYTYTNDTNMGKAVHINL